MTALRAELRTRAPLVGALADRVAADDLATHAAAMTYAVFLAIPPALLLGLSVMGFLLAGDATAQERLVSDLESALPGLGDAFGTWMRSVVDGRVTLGLVALPTVLWTSTGAFARARHSLAVVFGADLPSIVDGRLRGLVIQVPLGLGLVVLVTLNSTVSGLAEARHLDRLAELLALGVLWVAETGYFALTYRLLTPAVPFRDHLPGAALFATVWVVLHPVAAALVPGKVDAASALYGSIGVVFGLVAFLYATMWAFLMSAELSRLLRRPAAPSAPSPGPPAPRAPGQSRVAGSHDAAG